MTIEAGPGEQAVGGAERRSQRSVERIVGAVIVSVLVIIGLAAWVFMVPYEGDGGSGTPLRCDVMVNWPMDAEGRRSLARFEESCDEAESSRRTIALIVGATVATLAGAVSTWPSRRLTGEALGPLR